MTAFEEPLARVFARKGFTVATGRAVTGASGQTYTVPLMASADKSHLIVLWKPDGPVNAQEVREFGAVARALPARWGVLVAPAGVTDDAMAATAAAGVDLWTPARMAAEFA